MSGTIGPIDPKEQPIDPNRLVDVSHLASQLTSSAKPAQVYLDDEGGVCVQVFDSEQGCNGTPWEGTLRVSIVHTRAKCIHEYFKREFGVPITWDELQAVKDHLWPERIAIEIYPPHDKIVDEANMRWLWVLPAGAVLPFNLQGGSPNRLTSTPKEPG